LSEKSSATTPVVVVLFHREDETRKMFEQLARVTRDYSLVLINNGFDDTSFLSRLNPAICIKNEGNLGAIQGMNQGIEHAPGEYVVVLHSDVLIYDEGWLDEVLAFMERRPDVGLVGLQGAHTVKADGRFDYETNIAAHRGLVPESLRPSWRFHQVSMIDGVGWVMRNIGLRLDERYGMMHCYDLDLALQYIQAGYSVYVRATDFLHQIQKEGENVDPGLSARGRSDYLERVGGDDDAYFEQVTDQFRAKWKSMLPITRGFRDEVYYRVRAAELRMTLGQIEFEMLRLRTYTAELLNELELMDAEINDAETYIKGVMGQIEDRRSELLDASGHVRSLDTRLRSVD
jgi:GT2 family glycosyltransferase